jgi:predicted phosphodiesterase
MHIAIISDIHGNCLALDALLADLRAEPVDQIVCLGDAIQGGPQPAQVVARLQELACPVIMGNADAELITGVASEAEQMSEARRQKLDAVRDWQLTQLTELDIAFIKTFEPVHELSLGEGQTLLCFHGSPRSFNDIILPTTPDEEARRFLDPHEGVVYTGGHTHVQFVRHFGRTFHFNPGSVGLAYRHNQAVEPYVLDPWAEYAVLSVNGRRLELAFRRVPFEVEALIEIYRRSGRPFAADEVAAYGG